MMHVHESSDSLCPDCNQYDCGIEGHADPTETNLCVWCLKYDLVDFEDDPSIQHEGAYL